MSQTPDVAPSGTALTISDVLQNNAVVWIRSLPEAELGPSRRIVEDLEDLTRAEGQAFREIVVADKAELMAAFAEVAKLADEGWRPILHIDAHGSADEGLLLAPSGERATWAEVIAALRTINVATGNNLVCVFALCFGLHLYKEVSLSEPVPAYLFFAPPAQIQVGALEDQTLAFYRQVRETKNVTAAFAATLGRAMESFHCQGLFAKALTTYIRKNCRGQARDARREKVVTKVLQANGVADPDRAQLREARAKVRAGLTPGQHIIDHFAPSFLVGRPAGFNYADLERIMTGGPTRLKAGSRRPR